MKNLRRNLKIVLFFLLVQQSNSLFSSPNFLKKIKKGNSGLHTAIEESNKKDDMYIVWNYKNIDADLKKFNREGETPLILAVRLNDLAIVKFLIDKKGADVNQTNKRKDLSVLIGAIINENDDMIRLLIDRGADIYFISENYDQTPLQYAVMFKNIDAIKMILEELKKADYTKRKEYLNVRNFRDKTASDLMEIFTKDRSAFQGLLDDCLNPNFNPDGSWTFDEDGNVVSGECVYGVRQ